MGWDFSELFCFFISRKKSISGLLQPRLQNEGLFFTCSVNSTIFRLGNLFFREKERQQIPTCKRENSPDLANPVPISNLMRTNLTNFMQNWVKYFLADERLSRTIGTCSSMCLIRAVTKADWSETISTAPQLVWCLFITQLNVLYWTYNKNT